MFGRSKPIVFEPYGSRRSRWRVPRWLLLLLTGVLLGAAGVIFVQERYLPPRLSADASAKLRTAFEHAESERLRLNTALDDTTKRLETALAEKKGLAEELTASRQTNERLREDVALMVPALPADPRGGAIEVRAARFTKQRGALAYEVVLTRERTGKPFTGVVQFVVAGDGGRGAENTLTLKPVAVTVGSYEILRGSLPLPDGFTPRQTTVNVLDRVDGRLFGMRVMFVK